MAQVCDFTGKKGKAGNSRSHSLQATKRRFQVNLHTRKVDLGGGVLVKVKINSRTYKKLRGMIA